MGPPVIGLRAAVGASAEPGEKQWSFDPETRTIASNGIRDRCLAKDNDELGFYPARHRDDNLSR